MADENTIEKAKLDEAEMAARPPVIVPDDKFQSPPLDIQPGQTPDGWIPPEPEMPAADRLRAFEDEHFPDAVRIRDQIEKGSGSPFQMAKPAIREQHQALEKLIEAEAKLAAAHTALIQADTDYEAALAATEPKPDAPSE